MKNKFENDPMRLMVKAFAALSEEEQRAILARQAERRTNQPFVIENLTNAQIAEDLDFRQFCSERNLEPSKRQASKSRGEFLNWYHEKNK